MLVLVATIKTDAANRDAVREECLKLLEPTRKEAGCIYYNFHDNNKDKNEFTFLEDWESYATWGDHKKTEHIGVFLAALEKHGATLEVLELTQTDK